MQQLTGQSRDHLARLTESIWLHHRVIEPFRHLQDAAAAEGISLAIASGFRDFGRQLAIWNDKARGRRPVLSPDGCRSLDISCLKSEELVFAILRWSALPGASRHHWGTDMDVWDVAAVDPGYRLQLTPDEYSGEGPFSRLSHWLDSEYVRELGFYRPYQQDSGGVSPEPWHISFRPVADDCSGRFELEALADLIRLSDIELKADILANLKEIHTRFIRC